MLKYPKILYLFLIALCLIVVADYFSNIHYLVYVALGTIAVTILAWGSANVRSGLYLNAHYIGKNKGRVLSLSFDDGPDRNSTPLILDILKEKNIPATFFCTGENAEKEPDLIRRINAEGHIIGNHSYSHHFFFDLFREERMKKDVERSGSVIFGIIGRKMKFFRPPYGVTNPVLARVVRKSGYQVVGWSLKSNDTVISSEKKLIRRIERKMRAGDLVLLHDKGNKTAESLSEVIRIAKEKNYRFERADRLLNIEAYE